MLLIWLAYKKASDSKTHASEKLDQVIRTATDRAADAKDIYFNGRCLVAWKNGAASVYGRAGAMEYGKECRKIYLG